MSTPNTQGEKQTVTHVDGLKIKTYSNLEHLLSLGLIPEGEIENTKAKIARLKKEAYTEVPRNEVYPNPGWPGFRKS